jgi:protein gp37
LPADWGEGYPNVWLGVSVENRQNSGRIALLQRTKAITKFVSFEPLINHVGTVDLEGIDWAIIGGESGNNNGRYRFRECATLWIRSLVEQCQSQNVAVFVKQLGTHLAQRYELKDTHGGDISEFPEDLQIREFPTV